MKKDNGVTPKKALEMIRIAVRLEVGDKHYLYHEIDQIIKLTK